ncbi:MAG: hypothetical protein ACM3PU_09350 [Gemmatimonadota bacterium]
MHERSTQHSQLDLARAAQRLREETDLLCALEARGGLSHRAPAAGVEIETWLVDRFGRPAPQGPALIAALHSPDVVPGRARFQVVLRLAAQAIAADGLTRLMRELQSVLSRCQEAAQSLNLRLLTIGILPTVDDADLASPNISVADRSAVLASCRIEIAGLRERLSTEHRGIVPAAAATSLRAQLQLAPEVAARFLNASTIAAFASAGLAANAPYLLGAELWEDTRIALLQELRVDGFIASPEDYFRANQEQPTQAIAADEPRQRFAQLRLHNALAPRWNRLQVSFADDGSPQLLIEQFAMAPGPTPADIMANLSFHYGLTASLATDPDPPELRLDAMAAHTNLHNVARAGLGAEVAWFDRERMPLRTLAIVELIERAYEGLHQLGVDEEVAQRHLSLIERRVAGGQTGAVWQRRFVHAHGRNFGLLVREYAARQLGGTPVHEWNLRRLT